jgi:hypothetical protein
MGKNFESFDDVSIDVKNGIDSDVGSDNGGDLAQETGVDLNVASLGGVAGNSDSNRSLGTRAGALAALPFVAVAPEVAQINNAYETESPSAIYTEAPVDAGRTPEQVAEQWAEQQGARIVSPETEETSPPPSPLDVAGEIGEDLREAGDLQDDWNRSNEIQEQNSVSSEYESANMTE